MINLRSPLSCFMICRLSFRALIGGGDQPDEDGEKTLNFSEMQKNHRKERKVLQDENGEKTLKKTKDHRKEDKFCLTDPIMVKTSWRASLGAVASSIERLVSWRHKLM